MTQKTKQLTVCMRKHNYILQIHILNLNNKKKKRDNIEIRIKFTIRLHTYRTHFY